MTKETSPDQPHGEPEVLVAVAASQSDTASAIHTFLSGCPMAPLFGTPAFHGMRDGKDAAIALSLTALRVEHRTGALQHLTADDMLAIGSVIMLVDLQLSAHMGVTTRGELLQRFQ